MKSFEETNQFYHQAKDYAQALNHAGCYVNLIKIPHANHYGTMNVLADIESETFRATMNMIQPIE